MKLFDGTTYGQYGLCPNVYVLIADDANHFAAHTELSKLDEEFQLRSVGVPVSMIVTRNSIFTFPASFYYMGFRAGLELV